MFMDLPLSFSETRLSMLVISLRLHPNQNRSTCAINSADRSVAQSKVTALSSLLTTKARALVKVLPEWQTFLLRRNELETFRTVYLVCRTIHLAHPSQMAPSLTS